MLNSKNTNGSVVHFISGGMGGCIGAIVTAPLDVVKTRLQSSMSVLSESHLLCPNSNLLTLRMHFLPGSNPSRFAIREIYTDLLHSTPKRASLFGTFLHIIKSDGFPGLFRGLLPSLFGMIPSRAITLGTNEMVRNFLSNRRFRKDSSGVNIVSSAIAGFAQHTLTNPIWYIRTRLQLHINGHLSVRDCVKQVYARQGVAGFWRGVSASYLGVPEIVIMLVTYNELKKLTAKNCSDFWLNHQVLSFMVLSGFSKILASSLTYPHEVFRTRLREESGKYTKLWKTARLVFVEEGWRGLFGGMSAQLMRQIPNTIITFACYEYCVSKWDQHNLEQYFSNTRKKTVKLEHHENAPYSMVSSTR